ncbi:MAG: S8 family serine peptidase [Clostridia bacterium]|nr:S8 family serine peptidase [Clostridia bacterium]
MKIDGHLVNVLSVQDRANAIVKVHSFYELKALERNFRVVKYYPFISSIGVECDQYDVVRLSKWHNIEFVSAEMHVSALENSISNAIYFGKLPDVSLEGLTGEGTCLAVIDTGLNLHADICVPKNRICHFQDMLNGEEYPYDDNGHGTFVTGVAVGNGLCSGKEVVGVAPEAKVVSLKAISASGDSSTFHILDAMQWIFDNHMHYGIKVVCMSFGAEPTDTADPLKMGAEALARKGLTVVCAVGNNGKGNLKSPAISNEVIAVGAVDDFDEPAKFSSYGVYHGVFRPDVYAKGVNVRGIDAFGTYSFMSGTSVSAPYVAGVCCLLHEKYKNLNPYQAKRLILSMAKEKQGMRILRI